MSKSELLAIVDAKLDILGEADDADGKLAGWLQDGSGAGWASDVDAAGHGDAADGRIAETLVVGFDLAVVEMVVVLASGKAVAPTG